MERRWGKRKTLNHKVIVGYQKKEMIHGTIKDISVGGLFIKMTPKTLKANTSVNITIALRDVSIIRILHVPVSVIYLIEDGVGFKFERLDFDVLKLLVGSFLEEGVGSNIPTTPLYDADNAPAIHYLESMKQNREKNNERFKNFYWIKRLANRFK